MVGARGERRTIYVSRDFYATMDTQLSVFSDDVLELISDSDRYWWLVREPESGHSGYIPSEIVETPDEHEAKLNRQKNLELTRLRSTDLQSAGLPWRHHANDNIQVPETPVLDPPEAFLTPESTPWSRSGFARKSMSLRSAPAQSRHKKTVSFSETKPVEHRFTVDDSASCSSGEAAADPSQHLDRFVVEAEDSPIQEPYYDHQIDPIVDELLQREFGKPETPTFERCPPPLVQSNGHIPRSSYKPTMLTPRIDENDDQGKGFRIDALKVLKSSSLRPSKLKIKNFVAKFWRGGSRGAGARELMVGEQLLRVYAGNFTGVHGYKTLHITEGATMAEVADKAVEKFGLHGDRFNYVLSVVHYESHEVLQVAANYTLGTVIEMAKRATLMEDQLGPATNYSISKLPRKYRKQTDKTARLCRSALATPLTPGLSANSSNAFSCLASPVVQALSDCDLARSRETDFVTHYKFVLNRWLEGPAPTTPFYMRVQMIFGNTSRSLGIIPDGRKSRQTPKSPKSPLATVESKAMLIPIDDAKYQGNVKMLVNTSMSVAELCRTAQIALDIAHQVPGIRYELYLAAKPSQTRDRIFLSRDMVVHDILHLRPMVDPSGLVIVLQPVVDSKGGRDHKQ